jgi:hypothetical protein
MPSQRFKMTCSVAAPAPSTLHESEPSTLNPEPSTLNPQTSTLDPRPSTLDPQPSNFYPLPSTLNPEPPTVTGRLREPTRATQPRYREQSKTFSERTRPTSAARTSRLASRSNTPQKALCGGIPSPFLEPSPRSWSHFVGVYRQILTTSLKN